MDLQLKSKTAFVSGSTQGIGFAIARQLLLEGVKVIINGRKQEKIDLAIAALQQEISNAEVYGIVADFSDATAVAHLIASLEQVDILINNVGIFDLKPFTAITDEDWTRFFEINVMSGVRLSRALLPRMLARNWGRIVFISSESAINIPGNMIHYGMTKTAMLSVSRGLSQLTRNTQVTVNTVLGGPTYSEGVAAAVEHIAGVQNQHVADIKTGIIKSMNPTSLLQRFIEPAEIASLVVYLASPLAIATNGAALRADGGVLNTII